MEQLIKEVQDMRAQLGLKPLSNPKKLGRAKLEAMADQLEGKMEEREEMEAKDFKELKSPPTIEAMTNKINDALEASRTAKTVKVIACELLCEVIGHTEEGRSLGMPYSDILERIKEERPEAATSLNCLRWYAGKIRVLADGYQKYTLPQIRLRKKIAVAEQE